MQHSCISYDINNYNYKNFLYTSSFAKDVHSSTVNRPSFLGSYFLNKVSYSSFEGVLRPCFTGVDKNSCIMDEKFSSFTNPSFCKSCSVNISNMYQYNSTASVLSVLLMAASINLLYSSTLPWSIMGWGSMVAVLAAICSLQNFSHSSKVITPVALRSMESNIFCLAASLSASVLYKSESAGAYPYALGMEAAASISLEKEALLTSPSLLVSASTKILSKE